MDDEDEDCNYRKEDKEEGELVKYEGEEERTMMVISSSHDETDAPKTC